MIHQTSLLTSTAGHTALDTIKIPIRKLRYLARRPFKAKWDQKYRDISHSHQDDKETLVIYQMGKVGSSTIKKSLNTIDLDMNIYHVHALTHERIKVLKAAYKKSSRVLGRVKVHDHIVESAFLRNRLDANRNERWKLVTLVRDPVARNISNFFQSFDHFYPKAARDLKQNGRFKNSSIDDLVEIFLGKFDHGMPLRWFGAYLEPVFDIDVYSTEFPVENGYKIYRGANADLLLMRLEDISTCASSAFHEYMGIENFELLNTNRMEDKINYQAYRDFKEKIKLSETYVDKMYSSRFARHFYTEDEIGEFRRRLN